MILFNSALRVFYAALFAALAYGFLTLAAHGTWMAGVLAVLPLGLAAFFGWGAYRVASGRKPPASTAAMAVMAAALSAGAWWAYRELAVFGGSRFMQATASEGTRGSLGGIRSALSIYYGDMEGQYPADLRALTVGGKYLAALPKAVTVHHPVSDAVLPMSGEDYAAGRFTDAGGWYFVTSGSAIGTVGVNCTHDDARGKIWNAF